MNVFDVLREKLKQKKKILVDLSNEHRDNDNRSSTGYANKALAMGDAIEIINQVEQEYNNDVCEWELEKDMFIQNPHTGRKFSNEPSMKNVYCNTCGKKIKVIEC